MGDDVQRTFQPGRDRRPLWKQEFVRLEWGVWRYDEYRREFLTPDGLPHPLE